jgi:hypothetical protein
LDVSAIEGMLESFATAALGLQLQGPIRDVSALRERQRACDSLEGDRTVWVAWHTERGVATFRALYDEVQSAKVRAQVLRIAWWIGTEHHDGWWHCYPKFPRDWIKGIGRL